MYADTHQSACTAVRVIMLIGTVGAGVFFAGLLDFRRMHHLGAAKKWPRALGLVFGSLLMVMSGLMLLDTPHALLQQAWSVNTPRAHTMLLTLRSEQPDALHQTWFAELRPQGMSLAAPPHEQIRLLPPAWECHRTEFIQRPVQVYYPPQPDQRVIIHTSKGTLIGFRATRQLLTQ